MNIQEQIVKIIQTFGEDNLLSKDKKYQRLLKVNAKDIKVICVVTNQVHHLLDEIIALENVVLFRVFGNHFEFTYHELLHKRTQKQENVIIGIADVKFDDSLAGIEKAVFHNKIKDMAHDKKSYQALQKECRLIAKIIQRDYYHETLLPS